jgi:hypothetical protein
VTGCVDRKIRIWDLNAPESSYILGEPPVAKGEPSTTYRVSQEGEREVIEVRSPPQVAFSSQRRTPSPVNGTHSCSAIPF